MQKAKQHIRRQGSDKGEVQFNSLHIVKGAGVGNVNGQGRKSSPTFQRSSVSAVKLPLKAIGSADHVATRRDNNSGDPIEAIELMNDFLEVVNQGEVKLWTSQPTVSELACYLVSEIENYKGEYWFKIMGGDWDNDSLFLAFGQEIEAICSYTFYAFEVKFLEDIAHNSQLQETMINLVGYYARATKVALWGEDHLEFPMDWAFEMMEEELEGLDKEDAKEYEALAKSYQSGDIADYKARLSNPSKSFEDTIASFKTIANATGVTQKRLMHQWADLLVKLVENKDNIYNYDYGFLGEEEDGVPVVPSDLFGVFWSDDDVVFHNYQTWLQDQANNFGQVDFQCVTHFHQGDKSFEFAQPSDFPLDIIKFVELTHEVVEIIKNL